MARHFTAFCLVGLLAACASPPPSDAVKPLITYKHTAVLDVDVSRVEFVEAWQQPGTPPHIGHLHRNNPPALARAWAQDRLRASPGGPGAAEGSVLRVILRDGPVTQSALPVEEGVTGMFRDEADTRIDALCIVDLELVEPLSGRVAGIGVQVSGARHILESASLNEREQIYFALMEEMAAALDTALENGLNAELGFIIKR